LLLKREDELNSSVIDEILKSDISKMSYGSNNTIKQGGAKRIVDFMESQLSSYVKN